MIEGIYRANESGVSMKLGKLLFRIKTVKVYMFLIQGDFDESMSDIVNDSIPGKTTIKIPKE